MRSPNSRPFHRSLPPRRRRLSKNRFRFRELPAVIRRLVQTQHAQRFGTHVRGGYSSLTGSSDGDGHACSQGECRPPPRTSVPRDSKGSRPRTFLKYHGRSQHDAIVHVAVDSIRFNYGRAGRAQPIRRHHLGFVRADVGGSVSGAPATSATNSRSSNRRTVRRRNTPARTRSIPSPPSLPRG